MRELVSRLVSGEDLTESEAMELVDLLTDASTDPVLASAALAALRTKGESATEVRGFALRLRELAIRPDIPENAFAVDVVGTGGDESRSFNLSTGSALVAAAAGVPVIKHGNRSISSQSGSADLLEALGLEIPSGPSDAAEMFRRTGFTFLFAPSFHPAMKEIAPVRRALGIRTIFNIAGPLANPASPPFHVIGAYSSEMARTMAETLSGMPIERAFVVHGEPGWDEPTPVGPYEIFDVVEGSVSHSFEDPADLGIARCDPSDLAGGDAAYNSRKLRDVLGGERGAHRDALVLGAALALRVTGVDPDQAVSAAASAIDSGSASRLVESLAEESVGV